MEINYKKINPNGFQLLRFIQDVAIRFIIMFGGSSSGKSFSAAQIILIMTLLDGENTLVMRKVGASIEKTIYEDFKVAARLLHIDRLFKFQQNTIKCLLNGAKIDFSGLDNPEKIKGISNYKRILLEELSEFEEIDFKQLRKRLRGKKGQQIIATFNPIKETHWIKKNLFDVEKWHDVSMNVSIGGKDIPPELTAVKSIKMSEPKAILNPRTKEIEEQAPNMVIIQSTYLNNFWVVGSPCGTYGYYDEQCIADFEYDRQHDPDYYNVYALGEWGVIRTGSEFFGSFNRGKHSGEYKYNTSLPIHLSIDCNVLPYISVTYWQADLSTSKTLRQIDETCAETPNNTARKSAKLVAKRLNELRYRDKVYLHGDVSTRASNTIDENNRSFLDLFISTLEKEGFDVVDCVGKKNPSVSMSGEFINAIFEEQLPGINISISENCNVSIEDYMSVQKDANGAILKTKVKNKTTLQTYEEHGHLCFTGDTIVETSHGKLPISCVKIGDYVLSDDGYEYVYNSLCTSRNSRYFCVSLCGKTINCTYDHPIFTQRGYIPAYQLKQGDILTIYKNGKIWKKKLSSTTVLDLIDTQIANVKAIGNTIKVGLRLTTNISKWDFTGICGLLSVAKFLKVIVFIILMAITTITQLTTLLLCVLMSMKKYIQNHTEQQRGKRLKKGLTTIGIRLKNGIKAILAKSGILKIVKGFGKTKQWLHIPVYYAEKHLKAIVSKLQNIVLITAKANGVELTGMTMKNVFVQCVELNILSTNILKQNVVHGNVLLKIGGIADLYDISVFGHKFFANGILVHNCDTFRYVVCDILKDEFITFSNKRKRNLYARDGVIHFFNPDTECKYTNRVAYLSPNINGRFVLVKGCQCGDKWHITDVAYRETTSTDEIQKEIGNYACSPTVIECADVYFPMVRQIREVANYEIRAMRESADYDKRIAATSDYVKTSLLFNEKMLNESAEYSQFIASLLDYNKDSDNKEASAVLSGFIAFVVKSFSV